MKKCSWLAALVVALGCGGPVGPFSGGAFSGESKPAPGDWGFATNVEQVQIETNPAAPHSWNIWIAVKDGTP